MRQRFFASDIVFQSWADMEAFVKSQPIRATLLRKFSVVVELDREHIRSHPRIHALLPRNINNALDEFAKHSGHTKLVLAISIDGVEHILVFVRQLPADEDTEDHYNWIWIDEVNFIKEAPRPPHRAAWRVAALGLDHVRTVDEAVDTVYTRACGLAVDLMDEM